MEVRIKAWASVDIGKKGAFANLPMLIQLSFGNKKALPWDVAADDIVLVEKTFGVKTVEIDYQLDRQGWFSNLYGLSDAGKLPR